MRFKKQNFFVYFILTLITGLFLNVAAADTNVVINATRSVVSSSDEGGGLNTITLAVTINNTSTVDLTNLNLELMPNRMQLNIDSPTLVVSSLAAGSSTTVNWTIESSMSADMLGGSMALPMILVGQGADSLGAAVNVTVTSN